MAISTPFLRPTEAGSLENYTIHGFLQELKMGDVV
jgi:hypothetical protein